ncbi:amidase [Lentibacillus halophilus]|uniref:amidase n=1 Tax=Lentibacillus halophilus TaxID=295065 RepID=UPI0031D8ABC8
MSEISSHILNIGLLELSSLYKKKEISPVEVVDLLLNQIDIKNDKTNAYIDVCVESSLKEAKKAEKEMLLEGVKGALHGVPISIKDLIYTKDVKTTMGSGVFKDFIPDYDATVVEKLKGAGAIIIGKTNTHELAYGPTADNSYFGSVKNPYDSSKIAGGSSGGSAAAVATSLCYGTLGTDSGGSVRIPSSCSGVVGMKPTFGRISKYGVHPLTWTMDHVGPITKKVADNAVLLSYLSGKDDKDPLSLEKEWENCYSKVGEGLKGSVIGIPLYLCFENIQNEIKHAIQNAIKVFENLGAQVKPIHVSNTNDVLYACKIISESEAYLVNKNLVSSFNNLLGDETRQRILQGANYKASDYLEAQQIKFENILDYNNHFKDVDVMITPTLPMLPPNLGEKESLVENKREDVRESLQRFTSPTNLLGFPSLSLPCGFSASGLPIGMQLIGKKYDEANLYRFGYAFEQALQN